MELSDAYRVYPHLLSVDLNQLRGRNRKEHEDQLDALFCAYLSFYFWYWRKERTHLFGDTERGYILNPIATDVTLEKLF